MSIELLKRLNGKNRGNFYRLIESFKAEPNIAWYPSSGTDFRDLLYLNERYIRTNPGNLNNHIEPKPPDLFIHTDYYDHDFPERYNFHDDDRTTINLNIIEELPRLNLPLPDDQIVALQNYGRYNRAVFLNISINSTVLGNWEIPLIYLFVENATFCNEIALQSHASFSHIIHVRFGGGCGGGGYSSGIWIKNVLKRLNCRVLITDSHYYLAKGDRRIYELFPALGENDNYDTQTIREIATERWSNYGEGNVIWELIY